MRIDSNNNITHADFLRAPLDIPKPVELPADIATDTFDRPLTTTFAKPVDSRLAALCTQSAPPPPPSSTGAGWSGRATGNPVASQRAALAGLEKLQGSLDNIKRGYHDWKASHPNDKEPTDGKYTMGQIVDGDMPTSEQCLRLVMMLIHEHPELANQLVDAAPPSSSQPPPSTPAQQPDAGQNPLAGLMQTLGPICQIVGPIASILGGVLASPVGAGLLTAVCAVLPPPANLVAAAAPAIAPIAGSVLLGLGGVATGVGGLAARNGAPAPAPALPGQPGGGNVNVNVSGTMNAVNGMLNQVAPVAPAPPMPNPSFSV